MFRLHAHRKFWRTCAAAGALVACAGSASALSFKEAYEAALRNDPTYRMGFYEAEAGKENLALGRSALLPNVAINSSAYKNRVDLTTHDALGRENLSHPRYISRSSSITLRQPLINMDGVARYRQGAVQARLSEAVFGLRTDEVAVRVAGAYFEALLARDQLQLAKAQRDMLAEQSAVNKRLFERGVGTKTDMLETQARLDVAEAAVLEAEDNVTVTRNTLEGVVGMEVTALDSIKPEWKFMQLSPKSFEDWRAIALENNADLKAARLSVEAARLEITKARAGHAPRLDFVATYSKADSETINTYNQDSVNRSVGLQLNVPLYSGGAVSAQSRQAVANHERAKADLEARTDKTLVELRKAHAQVQSSVARIAALSKAVSSSQLLINATQQSIKGGERINLDLLTSQQQLTTSQRDLAQARYVYLLAALRMRVAAGTLTRADIDQVAGFFTR